MQTEQELPLGDMTVLLEITNERFLKYLLPPGLREGCFTGRRAGCAWGQIDIDNFDDKLEWGDFLLRSAIGVFAGFMTSVMAWQHTENRNRGKSPQRANTA
jgi:hypothetical protein